MDPQTGIYEYQASHVLPIVFACVLGLSLSMHIYQNLSVDVVPSYRALLTFTAATASGG